VRYPIPIITKKLLNSARKTTGKVRKVITGMNPCKLEFDVSAKSSSSYDDAEHFHPE
jgi:hypothetical protein